MKSKRTTYAENEFAILNANVENAIIAPFEKEIIALVNKFNNSGQSGGSAPYTAKAISQAVEKLCLCEPLTEIKGAEDEWCVNQNMRASSIFRNDNGYYMIDAVVFRDQNGCCFTSGSVDIQSKILKRKKGTISSKQYIKSFPFVPKKFYIDVISTEWADKSQTKKQVGGGWWSSVVKDNRQLDEVYSYYLKK